MRPEPGAKLHPVLSHLQKRNGYASEVQGKKQFVWESSTLKLMVCEGSDTLTHFAFFFIMGKSKTVSKNPNKNTPGVVQFS